MKMVEYAVSEGEGTLIRHGQTDHYPTLRRVQQQALRKGHTMIFAQAPEGSETGQ